MAQTVTVTIGRNVGDEPMSGKEWHKFKTAVRTTLSSLGGTVYVNGAEAYDSVWVSGTGNVRETSATYVADVTDVHNVRIVLAYLAGRYQQDAIALTIGETELIGADNG